MYILMKGYTAEQLQPHLHLLVLLNELQQLLYCWWVVHDKSNLRMHVISRLLAEAVQRIDSSRTRNFYWADLLALAGYLEWYNVPLPSIMEEKFEQSFHENKNHFTAKGGQYNLTYVM